MSIIESEDGLVRIYDDLYYGEEEDEANGFSKCTIQYKDEDGTVHAVWGDIKKMTGAWKEGDGKPVNGFSNEVLGKLYTFQVDGRPVYVLEIHESYPHHFCFNHLIAFQINKGRIEGYPLFIDSADVEENPICGGIAYETGGDMFMDYMEMLSFEYNKEEGILFCVPYKDTFDYYTAYHFDGKHLCGVKCDVEKLLRKRDI